jgi:putative endonuclease
LSERGDTGARGEDAALAFLQQRGLRLVTRNYRCRFGEIDLVLRDGEVLVFVEVRVRSSERFGGGGASIDGRKRERLLRAARHYLSDRATVPACRFDAMLLSGDQPPRIEWIINAFGE